MAAREYWLDIGAGVDAEHWAATPAPDGVLRVALDPLLTSGMVESGRLVRLPADIRRVGGEVRPAGSVEAGKSHSFLPFRSEVFTHVHCGFVLHLYLETLDLLAEECFRVLRPGGTVNLLLPHFGDSASTANLSHTQQVFRESFGNAERSRFEGPFTTFWADLYRDRTYRICCIK